MVAGNIDIVEVATQVVEAVATIAGAIQSLKILSLSRDYYKLYERQRNFYYSTFQTGAEAPLVGEIYGEGAYNKDYAGRVGRLYDNVTGPLGGVVSDISGWWNRHSRMYGNSANPHITALAADKARIQVDWSNHQFRFEDTWVDLRNDTRWARRMLAHNIATKQAGAVASALDGSLNKYQSHISDFGGMLATYGNGVAKYAGYKRGLSDTTDAFATGTAFMRNTPQIGPDKRYPKDTIGVEFGPN